MTSMVGVGKMFSGPLTAFCTIYSVYDFCIYTFIILSITNYNENKTAVFGKRLISSIIIKADKIVILYFLRFS